MKIQDLFSQLINTTGNPGNSLDNTETALVPVVASNTDNTEADVMIPPLQAKLELLKRATDVPNVYDEMDGEGCGCDEPCSCGGGYPDYESEEDDLDGIKRLAGIPATAIFIAGDDEPLEG